MHAVVLVCVVLALALEGVSLPVAVNMNGLSGEQLPFNDLMAHSRLFGSAEVVLPLYHPASSNFLKVRAETVRWQCPACRQWLSS